MARSGALIIMPSIHFFFLPLTGTPPNNSPWYHVHCAQTNFKTEREAYKRLMHLEGRFIPLCYAAVQIEPAEEDRNVPEANIYGLLLEDVGGVDLAQFDSTGHDFTASGHALLAAMCTVAPSGVLHHDIRSGNVIARPASASSNSTLNQLILIDFGHAWLKGGDTGRSQTDEAFETEALSMGEVNHLAHILHRNSVRTRSPFDTRYSAGNGYHDAKNEKLWNFPEKDLQRWFDELPRELDDPQPDPLKSTRDIWRTKPAVLQWLATRPDGIEGIYVRRPGSPD